MSDTQHIQGSITHKDGEEYYKIHHIDKMPAFFISLVSDQDHWLFAGSLGGLSAGRVSPETALFPYQCVDKIYDTAGSAGARTMLRCHTAVGPVLWEPFNLELDGAFDVERNLYKNVLGNKLCYQEINHELGLTFEYEWSFSDQYGVVRSSRIRNQSDTDIEVEVLDGLVNVLPAGAPRHTQTVSSNLVDAYKFNEVDPSTGLALYSLYSAITDRAEPAEALRATTVFALGLESPTIVLDASSLRRFKLGQQVTASTHTRGIRGAYLLHTCLKLASSATKDWYIVANTEQNQTQISQLAHALRDPNHLRLALRSDIELGSQNLRQIMGVTDGFQVTAEREVSLHHYANTLFNVLRGGFFANQYNISAGDLAKTIAHFNQPLYAQVKEWLSTLPEMIDVSTLKAQVAAKQIPQLQRLVEEYLPITFGRRHGDPSRPWNQFAIQLKDEFGDPLLSYQGNWRDIFQNWEALTLSYPRFIASVIAKFVNASTMDGYNPYRITKQGIDWEVEEPDDPWSYIGYWGDHQIIYLQKLLEVSDKFSPSELAELLTQQIYAYANVPYRIRSYQALCADPKETVDYDHAAAERIEKLEATLGADAKLVLQSDGSVYQVSLLEKLVVPLLTKLSNLVIDGGIWLNTQRPEWNDANNALVGQGLSMVTLYYMNRYVTFLQRLVTRLMADTNQVTVTAEVADWLHSTYAALSSAVTQLDAEGVTTSLQKQYLDAVGQSASDYRTKIYSHSGDFVSTELDLSALQNALQAAQTLILHSIEANRTDSGMYHAYNILTISNDELSVGNLYEMLEGQVAALSSGALSPKRAVEVLSGLFCSAMYRHDIGTFMLYPDRPQSGFMHKNLLQDQSLAKSPLISEMLARGDFRILQKDADGQLRFASFLFNKREIERVWPKIQESYPALADTSALQEVLRVYEATFRHAEFTGRSGGMFGFEGLGCVYWHMVSKLLLAVQEVTVAAHTVNAPETQELLDYYYKVREGIGFNKTPDVYGAFPTDPYSHTPKHAGAQQPGMTGQVKEELLTRFGELGCQVEQGVIRFDPFMLRRQEFMSTAGTFSYINLNEQEATMDIPANSLAFTWCQVPIVYSLNESASSPLITVTTADGNEHPTQGNQLSKEVSQAIFNRDGSVASIHLTLPTSSIYSIA